jgi:hypothetical protein
MKMDDKLKIFLAGTIDDGNCENWQKAVVEALKEYSHSVEVYNPRRDDWDKGAGAEAVMKQINWEQDHLNDSDVIFMVLKNDSLSPISLLELGEFADTGKVIVFCEQSFWRFWNVADCCLRFGLKLVQNTTTEHVIDYIKEYIEAYLAATIEGIEV